MAKNKINYKKIKLQSRLEANEIMPQYSISPKFMSAESYNNPDDLVSFMRAIWPDDMDLRERMFIAFLTVNLKIKGFAEISAGGYNNTIASPQLIAALPLITGTKAVALFHNHPSRNKYPSGADNNLTRNASLYLHLMDINLLDHIIITSDGYYSYGSEGCLLTESQKNDFFKTLFAKL